MENRTFSIGKGWQGVGLPPLPGDFVKVGKAKEKKGLIYRSYSIPLPPLPCLPGKIVNTYRENSIKVKKSKIIKTYIFLYRIKNRWQGWQPWQGKITATFTGGHRVANPWQTPGKAKRHIKSVIIINKPLARVARLSSLYIYSILKSIKYIYRGIILNSRVVKGWQRYLNPEGKE